MMSKIVIAYYLFLMRKMLFTPYPPLVRRMACVLGKPLYPLNPATTYPRQSGEALGTHERIMESCLPHLTN